MPHITRQMLADHIAEYVRPGGASDNPEYGGDHVDWVWDWLVAHGSLAPATGPDIKWLTLKSEGRSHAADQTR